MEELFVYSLLCVIGYDKYDEYQKCLDCLFLSDISNEELLDLEGRAYKDAILHTLHLLNVKEKNIDEFGKQLMRALKPIYYESDIVDFGNRMYELWNRLPDNISNAEPFHTFSYANDCLSYGDEKQSLWNASCFRLLASLLHMHLFLFHPKYEYIRMIYKIFIKNRHVLHTSIVTINVG